MSAALSSASLQKWAQSLREGLLLWNVYRATSWRLMGGKSNPVLMRSWWNPTAACTHDRAPHQPTPPAAKPYSFHSHSFMVGQGGAVAKSPHSHPNGSCESRKRVFLLGVWPHLEGPPPHCRTLLWALLSCSVAASLVVPALQNHLLMWIFWISTQCWKLFSATQLPQSMGLWILVRFVTGMVTWKYL